MSKSAEGLTIGGVAELTGLSTAVLRAWERRFGFPTPDRLVGGHRRYAPSEVDRIREVMSDRAQGRSLESAIAAAQADNSVQGESLYATVRHRQPDLPVHTLSRRAMLAISHAIEDECRAEARRPVLIAAFQREELYRAAQTRWNDLTHDARTAIVFADFPSSRRPAGGAFEVSLNAAAPLRREWAVICADRGAGAMLVGRERLAPSGDGRPGFEAVWTVEPEAVAMAATIGLQLARGHAPGLFRDTRKLPEITATGGSPYRWATGLTNRIVRYLDH